MYQNIYYSRKNNSIHLWDDKKGYSTFPYKKYAYIKSPTGNNIALDGTKVKKVFGWDKEDESRGVLYESDISPETRTLIDMYHDSDAPSLVYKIMMLDIEVDMTIQLPNTTTAENEITAIALYLKDLDHYSVFVLDKEKALTEYNDGNKSVYPCRTEADLLELFLEFYSTYEPSIITGWNIDFFDIPYLYNRISKVLGKKSGNSLSPIGVVEQSKHTRVYNIAGVSCLDYLPLYKKYVANEEPSYTLDAISLKELGKGKIKYDGTLDDLFRDDINKFIEYNLTDVVLVKELDDKLKYIELTRSICHKGHVPYNSIFASSKYLEGAILTYMKTLNIIAPNKPTREVPAESIDSDSDDDSDSFAGAYVKPPIAGRYEWLNCIDATSLYPTSIMTLNISHETKIGKIPSWPSVNMMAKYNGKTPITEELILNLRNGKTKTFSKDELHTFLKDNKYSIAANGAVYITKQKGLIPAILELWFSERLEYKELMKKYALEGNKQKEEYFDQLQYTTKILLNSMYGVLGLRSFRFFDLDNAEAVTLTGQDVLKFADITGNGWIRKNLVTKLQLDKYGVKLPDTDYCVYSDTDSNYFNLNPFIIKDGTEIDQIRVASKGLCDHINSLLPKFTYTHLYSDYNKLEFKEESAIKSAFFLAKKRYAYHKVWDLEVDKATDKLIIKGLDVVRSNFPPLFRNFMRDILNDILKFESKNVIDTKVADFQSTLTKCSTLDISKPTSAKNLDTFKCKGIEFKKGTPAHIKAALAYNFLIELHGLEKTVPGIRSGAKIKWVYLRNNPFNLDGMAFTGNDDPKQIMDFIDKYIDYNKNFESNLLNKFQNFYDALSWGDLPRANHKKINKFFEF